MSRTGRRPGVPGTREAILGAARRKFGARGYDATSVRSIAAAASVDPALVIHYFGTKEALFAAAVGLPAQLPGTFAFLAALPPPDRARALVRSYLEFVDSDSARTAILALIRSAVSHDKAAAMLREFMASALLPAIGGITDRPDGRLRASLAAAQLIGIAMLRHVLRLEPLSRAAPDDIVTLAAPAIERYLRLPPAA